MTRKLLLTFCFGIATLISSGQDSTKVKRNQEFFLEVSSFSPLQIGLNCKIQLKNNTYLKIGIINVRTSYTEYEPLDTRSNRTSTLSLNGGIGLGLEFRKEISSFLTLYHGPNLIFNRHYDRNSEYLLQTENEFYRNSNLKNVGSCSYSIGFLAKVTPHFLVAADLNPMVSISRNIDFRNGYEIRKSKSFDFDLTNQLVKISIVFRK